MKKSLNKLGLSIVSMKEELMHDYSSIIKESLLFQALKYMEEGIISSSVYQLIKDNTISKEILINELMENNSFLKTKEERLLDLKDISQKLIEEFDLGNLGIDLMIDNENEELVIKKALIIPIESIVNLFKINKEDVEKNKSFFIKYVTLRFPKIVSNFMELNAGSTIGYTYSDPFNTKSQDSFGIFVIKNINVDIDVNNDEISQFIEVSNKAKDYFLNQFD